jgi:hypothetical protein
VRDCLHTVCARSWLPNLGGTDFVAASKHFGPMKAAGVSFYDEAATLPIAVKQVVAKDYGVADEDSDLVPQYFLGSVSG